MSWGEEQKKEIETIRERKITVKLSDADCDRLARKCGEHGLTIGELIENFVGDLVGGIAIGVGFLIFLGASKVFEFYTEDYADTMSLAVFLISLAVSVYFAEPIRAVIPINLLLLLILVHIVYVLIRWYVKGCMRSRGYY